MLDKFKLASLSVKLPACTSIVHAPSLEGVNVAVYAAPEPEKPESIPLVTLMSEASKSKVLSEALNNRDKFESFDVSPSFTSAAVMVMVGAVRIARSPL